MKHATTTKRPLRPAIEVITPSPPACEHGGASFRAIGDEFDDLSRRQSVVAADVLDAWFDPAPAVIEVLKSDPRWLARTSPPTGCEGLIRAIARARHIPEGSIVVGAGSSALIYLAFTRWLSPTSRTLILEPTYGEYAHVLERVVRCTADRLPLKEEDNFAVPRNELAGRLASGHYDLAVIVNPNNPTGTVIPRAALEQTLAAAHPRTTVWIDEAYCEYAEEFTAESAENAEREKGKSSRALHAFPAPPSAASALSAVNASIEPFAAASQNVIVCKTMSKVYALSGLRAAYLCGPSHRIAELRTLTPPWAVSLPGQIAAVRALASESYYRTRWRRTHELRQSLAARLREAAPWQVIEGCLNAVLCLCTPGMPRSVEIVAACRERGVFLRDCSGLCPAFEGKAVRIAVRGEEESGRIVRAVQESVS